VQRASSHFDNLRRRTDIASKFPLYLKYDIYIGQVWATGTQDFNPSTQAAVFDVDATFDTDQSHRRTGGWTVPVRLVCVGTRRRRTTPHTLHEVTTTFQDFSIWLQFKSS
jgi:hypothetical protein